MRGEGARRADEVPSLEAAKSAKDLPPTERWSCFGGGFLAVFAAQDDVGSEVSRELGGFGGRNGQTGPRYRNNVGDLRFCPRAEYGYAPRSRPRSRRRQESRRRNPESQHSLRPVLHVLAHPAQRRGILGRRLPTDGR